jgi:GxGYxYP putative glycoside hydrolase C-terminal domain
VLPQQAVEHGRTATDNDYLMAGPSGAGYEYPDDWPAAELGVFTRLTRRYMDRTGLDAVAGSGSC